MNDIESSVIEALSRRAKRAVSLDDDFDLLGIDSLAMAELTYELEQQLRLRMSADIVDLHTVRDLVEYLQKLYETSPREAETSLQG